MTPCGAIRNFFSREIWVSNVCVCVCVCVWMHMHLWQSKLIDFCGISTVMYHYTKYMLKINYKETFITEL